MNELGDSEKAVEDMANKSDFLEDATPLDLTILRLALVGCLAFWICVSLLIWGR